MFDHVKPAETFAEVEHRLPSGGGGTMDDRGAPSAVSGRVGQHVLHRNRQWMAPVDHPPRPLATSS
eukprot:3016168-Prorocentrum_lima.AAC.1